MLSNSEQGILEEVGKIPTLVPIKVAVVLGCYNSTSTRPLKNMRDAGSVTLSNQERDPAGAREFSGDRDRRPPRVHRCGAEDAVRLG
jgi:hypothetical protein